MLVNEIKQVNQLRKSVLVYIIVKLLEINIEKIKQDKTIL